jgi:hypothetical protein
MKTIRIWIVTAAAMAVLSIGCAGSKPVPVADLQRFWGAPLRIEVLPDGSQKWHYRFRAEGQGVPVYFIVRDGLVIDQG